MAVARVHPASRRRYQPSKEPSTNGARERHPIGTSRYRPANTVRLGLGHDLQDRQRGGGGEKDNQVLHTDRQALPVHDSSHRLRRVLEAARLPTSPLCTETCNDEGAEVHEETSTTR